IVFFFFQAEDGIRDRNVTGVQTCSLPISIVTKGNATGAIVQTVMNTALGQIASLLDSTEKKLTPLELKLMELGKILIYIVLLLTAATVFIGIFHGEPIYDMFLAG